MKKTISFKKNLEFPTMIGEVTAISLEENLKFLDESNVTGEFKITGRYKMTEASRLEEDFNYELPVEILLTEKIELDTAKVDVEDFYYEIEDDDTMICYIDVKVEGVELIEELEQSSEPVLIDIEDLKSKEIELEVDKEERCIEEETTEEAAAEENYLEESKSKVEEEIRGIDEESKLAEEKSCIEEHELSTLPDISEIDRECDGEYINKTESEEMQVTEKQEQTIEINQEVGSLFSSFKDSDETFATYSVYILRQEETLQTIIEKYSTTKEELEKYNDLTNLTIGTKIIIPTRNE